VILKSDGFPPYHLAAIVDDHDMAISHAIRSTEWLSSSPKHFCLYAALGWEPPLYVHVANVNGPDGKKLAKRTGAKPVVGRITDPKTGEVTTSFLDDGYLEDALFNYLALTGWSPGDESEILPRDEVVRRFNVDGLSVSPAVFDLDKLTWMNGVYIRQMDPAELAGRVLPFLAADGLVPADPDEATRDYVGRVLLLEQERLKRLDEAPELTAFFFGDLPEYESRSVERRLKREPEAVPPFLEELAAVLADLPDAAWLDEPIETRTRAVGERHGRERGELTHPVRVAVTGREVGPGLFETMAVLGRERVLRRLRHAAGLARG
jgi:glutamyl-tRNA synthetase